MSFTSHIADILEYSWLDERNIELKIEYQLDGSARSLSAVTGVEDIDESLIERMPRGGSLGRPLRVHLQIQDGVIFRVESLDRTPQEDSLHVQVLGDPEIVLDPHPSAKVYDLVLVHVRDGDTIEARDPSGELAQIVRQAQEELNAGRPQDQKIRVVGSDNVIPIRFVGVNTPELNSATSAPPEMGAQEAYEFLSRTLGPVGSPIRVEIDTSRLLEEFGRLLAVVYVGGENINRKIIRAKHSKVNYIGEEQRYFNNHDLSTWAEFDPNRDLPGKRDYSADTAIGAGLSWESPIDNRRFLRGDPAPRPGDLWIGDCYFQVPPIAIRASYANPGYQMKPLRSNGSIQSQTGHTRVGIEIELYFNGLEQINGKKILKEVWEDEAGRHEVELPYGDHGYVIDGLRSLIAQFKTFPFLPIENDYINGVLHVDAVALQNLVVRTVPGFPGVLQATLYLVQFDLSAYIYDETDLSKLIQWPLFRWHMQQKLLPPEMKSHRYTTLHPIPDRGLSDAFLFGYVPSEFAWEYNLVDKEVEIEPLVGRFERAEKILSDLNEVEEGYREAQTDTEKKYENARIVHEAIKEYEEWVRRGHPDERLRYQKNKFFYPTLIGIKGDSEGKPTFEDRKRVFVLPLYDPATLYEDHITAALMEDKVLTPQGETSKKIYQVDASEIKILYEVYHNWITYQHYLEADASMSESDLSTWVYPIENLRLVSMEFSLDNNLAEIQMDAHDVPTYQYLGSMDTFVRMVFETRSEEAISQLQYLLEYSRKITRNVRSGVFPGFLTLRNDLTRLFGIESILIHSVHHATVSNQPGMYRVEVLAFSFNRNQRDIEAFRPIVTEIRDEVKNPGNKSWIEFQKKLKEIEVYPDLELPTYEELEAFLNRLEIRPNYPENRGKYVDPDFFIRRTHRLTESLKKVLENPATLRLGGRDSDAWEAEAKAGEPIEGIKDPREHHSLVEAQEGRLIAYWSATTVIQSSLLEIETQDGIKKVLVSRDKIHETIYNLAHGNARIEGYEVSSSLFGPKRFSPSLPIRIFQSENDIIYIEPNLSAEREYVGPKPSQSPQEAFMNGHFDAFFEHDKRGRLVRAFPAFAFFLVDEGPTVGTIRFSDLFYGLGSILSIDVARSRERAADLAVITFTDLYHKLHIPIGVDPDEGISLYRRKPLGPFELPEKYADEIAEERSNVKQALDLRTGARVHLRLGYGSNAASFPISFNGTVAEIQTGDVMTIACQSDGAELAQFPASAEFSRGTGTEEPRDGIMQLLMGNTSYLERLIRNWSEGRWFNRNTNGIAHFGRPALPDGLDWEDIVKSLGAGAVGGTALAPLGPLGATAGVLAGILSQSVFGYIGSVYDWLKNHLHERPWAEGEMGDNVYAANGIGIFTELPKDAFGPLWWFKAILSPTSTITARDELNIAVRYDGMTMWDIIQTYAMCTPDYIASVEPFELRSTLFFGKPYFGLAYGYDPNYTPLEELEEDGRNDDFEQRRERARREALLRRPLCQFHYADDRSSIVTNRIRASKETVFNNVRCLYYDRDNQSSILVHADTDIVPEDQKTVIVNAPLVATGLGQGYLASLGNWLADLIGPGKTDALALINTLFRLPAINNFAVSTLQDYMRTMYQGQIVMLGDSSIKPWDLLHISDMYNQIHGPVQVRSVTHSFSVENGFLTTITPDACVFADDPYLPSFAIWGSTVATGIGVETMALMLYQAGTLHWIVQKIVDRLPQEIAKEVLEAFKSGKVVEKLEDLRPKIGSLVDDLVKDLTSVTRTVGERSRVAAWTIRTIGKGAETIPKIVANVGASALVKGVLKLVGAYALGELITVAGEAGWASFMRYLRNRQAVVMVLLTYKGRELSAGIKGHKGLVYGDTIGHWDEWIEKLTFGSVDYGPTSQEIGPVSEPIAPGSYTPTELPEE